MLRYTKTIKVVLAVGIFGLLVFFNSAGGAQRVRIVGLRALSPVMSLAASISTWLSGSENSLSADEVARLVQENQRLTAAQFELEELREENTSLRSAARFSAEHTLELIGAPVVGFTRDFGKESLIVMRGKESGIIKGATAVDEYGFLVGTVGEVLEKQAKVDIASNPGSVFEGTIIPLHQRVLTKGIGGRVFSLELLPADAPVHAGDFVAVSVPGLDREILAGTVVSVTPKGSAAFKEAKASLLAHPEEKKIIFIARSL